MRTERVTIAGLGAVQVVYESRLMRLVPKRFIAMTLGRTIHVRGTHLPVWVLRHELAHVRQWERYGRVGFLARYLWQCARYGYANAPLELEAEAAEVRAMDATATLAARTGGTE
jgi:hypothetical protein